MDTEQKLEAAIKALQKIDNPISAIRAELQEGERLSPQAAIIANSSQFLQEVARDALSVIIAKSDVTPK